jgi:hypothetical protein
MLEWLRAYGSTPAIDRVALSRLDRAALDERMDRAVPFVVSDMARGWAACDRWRDVDYLVDRIASDEVGFQRQAQFNKPESYAGHRVVPFDEAAAVLKSDSEPVVSIYHEGLGKLAADVDLAPAIAALPRPRGYPRWRYFLGRNNPTAWHIHVTDETFATQVIGPKVFVLLRPTAELARHRAALDRDEYLDQASPVARFLERKLDESQRPFGRENPDTVVVHLAPPDSLYIPALWLHGVIAAKPDDFIFTLSYCWASPLHIYGELANPMVRAVLRGWLTQLSWRSRGLIAALVGPAVVARVLRNRRLR